MTTKSRLYLGVAALAIAVVLTGSVVEVSAQQSAPAAVAIDNDDIGGVVTGANGPEAGVWVIAETTDLPTRYAKMVVTDDQGRYVVPDLPKAKYKVWVRGYGLVDSAKVDGEPGKQLNLTAVAAPNEAEAAKYYPAIYWYSMLKIPDASQFGKKDGDIPDKVKQSDWLNLMKNNGCVGCHQLGQLSTRTFPPGLGEFSSHAEAWVRRIQSGQAGELMVNILAGQLAGAPIKYFADWTDRVAKGELPKTKPTRPQGRRAQRRRHHLGLGRPEELSARPDRVGPAQPDGQRLRPAVRLSPNTRPTCSRSSIPRPTPSPIFKAPVRDADTPEGAWTRPCRHGQAARPFAYWGDEKIWDTKVNNHNSMFDKKGRVWLAAAVRGPKNPDFCKKGSDHPSAKLFPLEQTHRALAMHRSQDDEVHLRRHLLPDPSSAVRLRRQRHAVDQQRRRRRRGRLGQHQDVRRDRRCGEVAGLDGAHPRHQRQRQARRVCRAQPAARSRQGQAHRAGVLRGDAEPGRRLGLGDRCAPAPARSCGSTPGSNPPETALAEIYNVPMPGFGPRGGDIDSKGVVWVSLASGHIGSFDRRKCKGPLNGPNATGDHCPEGWTFYQYPGPGLRRHRREQRRVELLHLGRPAQHVRARQGRADVDRQPRWTAWSRSRTAR